jgi:hypothetical protein
MLPDKSGNYKIFWEAVELDVKLGDVVRLKKPHPCGSYEWQVVRLGADISIKCLKCHRRVLLERGVLERRLKGIQKEYAQEDKRVDFCLLNFEP